MKKAVRTHVAALALLAPIAATVAALPGVAVAQQAPQVRGLSVNADDALRPGSDVHFSLQATPGSRASLALGNTDIVLNLRETAAGVYTATHTVSSRDRIDPLAMITARVVRNNVTTTHNFSYPADFQALAQQAPVARAAAPGLVRAQPQAEPHDRQPPTVVNLSPRHGEVVPSAGLTTISGTLQDVGRGIDPDSVRLSVGGRDVSNSMRVTPEQFSYRSDLPPGRYTAEVSAKDYAGNAVRKTWSFDVSGAPPMGAAPAYLPLIVSSPHNNAVVDANGNLTVHGRTAPFAQVVVRVDAVPPSIGNRASVAQTITSQPVQADRDGNFSVQVVPRSYPIPGTRYDVSLQATHNSLTSEQRLVLFQRQG